MNETTNSAAAGSSKLPRGLVVVEVVSASRIAPSMQRIMLGSPHIASLPDGPNVKLFIPPVLQEKIVLPDFDIRGRPFWRESADRPTARTYSVRRIDRKRCLLEVDFVLHGHGGSASTWAEHAKPGDQLLIGGPGGRKTRDAAWYVLAGDISALPAISHILEELPETAKGVAFIETPDPADRLALVHPDVFSVQWLHNNTPVSMLPRAVRTRIDWANHDDCFLWVAGESDAVRAIRAFARDELKLDRRMIMAVGYWRRGMSEDAYHESHDNDRDADYHAVWLEERLKTEARVNG